MKTELLKWDFISPKLSMEYLELLILLIPFRRQMILLLRLQNYDWFQGFEALVIYFYDRHFQDVISIVLLRLNLFYLMLSDLYVCMTSEFFPSACILSRLYYPCSSNHLAPLEKTFLLVRTQKHYSGSYYFHLPSAIS